MRFNFYRRRQGKFSPIENGASTIATAIVAILLVFAARKFRHVFSPAREKPPINATGSMDYSGSPSTISTTGTPMGSLFREKCAFCHGEDGRGNALNPSVSVDLAAKPWKTGTDREKLREMLRSGIPGKVHLTLKDLPPEDLDQLTSSLLDFASPTSSSPSELTKAITRAHWNPVGRAAPPLSLRNSKGEVKPLSKGLGKVTLLCYWSPRCPAALMQLSVLDRLLTEVPDLDFIIVPICSEISNPNQAEQALRKLSPRLVSWTLVKPNADEAFDIRAYPTSILIDRDGRMQARIEGLFDAKRPEFLRLVRLLLAQPAGQ